PEFPGPVVSGRGVVHTCTGQLLVDYKQERPVWRTELARVDGHAGGRRTRHGTRPTDACHESGARVRSLRRPGRAGTRCLWSAVLPGAPRPTTDFPVGREPTHRDLDGQQAGERARGARSCRTSGRSG